MMKMLAPELCGNFVALPSLSLRSANSGHTVRATPSPKCSASPRTSHTRETLSDVRSRNHGDNQVYAIKEGAKWEDIK